MYAGGRLFKGDAASAPAKQHTECLQEVDGVRTEPAPVPRPALPGLLCLVVMLLILLSVLYAGWIGISNFSRIGV